MTSRSELLFLCRILCAGQKGISAAEIQKTLATYFQHRLSEHEWSEQVSTTLQRLNETGLISARPQRLTPAGRDAVCQGLAVGNLPARISWKTMQSVWLPGLALDAPLVEERDRTRFKTGDGLRAWILKSNCDLNIAGCPTLPQALTALVWKELFDIDSTRTLTTAAIIEEIMRRKLPADVRLKKKQLVEATAARFIKADKPTPDGLRLAAIRGWLVDAEPAATSLSLEEFAHRVLAAARASTTGWFGDHKVFISHVWRAIQKQPGFKTLDDSTFKKRLTEAHREGLLALSRADLVEAMDPKDVSESVTHSFNAVFHFVQCTPMG